MIGDGHRARSTMPNVLVSTALLAAPEWLLTSPESRGHWICLLGYCARAENGGLVVDAASWSGIQWALVLGPTGNRASIDRIVAEGLAEWRGEDLLLGGYPERAERTYKAQRIAGQRRAAARQREAEEMEQDQTGSDSTGSDLIRSRAGSSPGSSPGNEEGEEDPPHHCNAAPGMCHHKLRSVRD